MSLNPSRRLYTKLFDSVSVCMSLYFSISSERSSSLAHVTGRASGANTHARSRRTHVTFITFTDLSPPLRCTSTTTAKPTSSQRRYIPCARTHTRARTSTWFTRARTRTFCTRFTRPRPVLIHVGASSQGFFPSFGMESLDKREAERWNVILAVTPPLCFDEKPEKNLKYLILDHIH